MGGNSFNDMLHLHYEVNWINQISSFTFKSADFYLFIFNIQSKNSPREFRFLCFLSSSESRVSEIFISLPTTEFACSTKGQSDGSVDRNIYLRIVKAWFQPSEPRIEGGGELISEVILLLPCGLYVKDAPSTLSNKSYIHTQHNRKF